jgi:ribosome recycling factor
MIEDVLSEAETKMKKSNEALKRDLTTIRTGRASPSLVEHLPVDYHGTMMPLNQLAGIAAPEPRMITIQPWDKSSMGLIEKAILKSDLGLNPTNDGKMIRVAIPHLTEERRKELVKVVKGKVEEGKVSIRNIRRDSVSDLKDMQKEKMISEDDERRAQEKLQHMVDNLIKETDAIGQTKEHEIMEV